MRRLMVIFDTETVSDSQSYLLVYEIQKLLPKLDLEMVGTPKFTADSTLMEVGPQRKPKPTLALV